jgi:diguanylate cyclase (GGDEF)-like protein
MKITLNSFLNKLKTRSLSGWRSLMLGPIVLASFLLFVIWSGTFARIQQEEKIKLESVQIDNGNIARIVAANLDEVLGKANIYADMATTIVSKKNEGLANFKPALLADRAFLRLAIFDAKQRLIYSSTRKAQEPLLSGMIVQAKKQSGDPKNIFVGHPDTQSGEIWHIPIILPLGENAKYGYLGGHLDLGYFLRLYQGLNLGRSGRVEIIGEDGFQLIESNGTTISPGQNIANSDYFALIQQRKENYGAARHPGDQFDSIVAFEHLDRFPFAVAISRSRDEVLSENVERKKRYLWEAWFQTFALLAAAFGLVLLAWRQQDVFLISKKSEHEKNLRIGELENERNNAYQQASHDHLTGLPNRMLFAEVASNHLSAARRSRNLYAVFFIDLDRFKLINDTLGHRVGDLLLCEVARRIQGSIRESDFVARFGGDEFVVLISEVATTDDLGLLAAKIIAAVGQPCNDLDGHRIEVRPSLGIAIYGRDGQDIAYLTKRADAAMYNAKAAGRGTFRFFDASLNRATVLHVDLAQQLQNAIANGELTLYFQAQVAIEESRVSGLEALVRWAHPKHGTMFPIDFIPMAEADGLIIPLGYWVIEAVCQQLSQWQKLNIPLVPIAINMSCKQLHDDELVMRITSTLEKYSVPGDLLEIEITESCLDSDLEKVLNKLNVLKAKGIGIAIDAYGIGYSNLGRLKSLPIHRLKIDRSLIADILNQHNDAIVVDSTITLAKKLGLRVVAVGVETREQLLHLKVAGCDEAQGYFFRRPEVSAEIKTILCQGKI